MNSFRIGLVGLAAAVGGFVLQGCFAVQPPPECMITAGNAYLGVTNYKMLLTETSHTGASCPDMPSMEIGMMRFGNPDGGAFRVAARPARLVDMASGSVFEADTDLTNDCTKPANGCSTCVPVIQPPNLNVCKITMEPLARTDPSDPDGKGLIGFGEYTRYATNGVCTLGDIKISQNFQAEAVPNADGGSTDFPALATSVELSNVKVMVSSLVPGTAFTGKMKYTEGTDCVANYDFLAIWPIVGCSTDVDCSPDPDYDAGRIYGSGMNPNFNPVCNVDVGICVPSVDVTTLK